MIVNIYRKPNGLVAKTWIPGELPPGYSASVEDAPGVGQYWDILLEDGEGIVANGFAPSLEKALLAIELRARDLD